MEVLVSRGCGLDVHQATVVACLLTGQPGKLPRKQVKTFSTMTSGLTELRDWLKAGGCTAVAMEAHHRQLLSVQPGRLDRFDRDLKQMDAKLEVKLKAYARQMELLDGIPGIDWVVAATVIAEIGVKMSQWPSVGHLTSWAGLCPGQNESAGKRGKSSVRPGNPYLRSALVEAALAVTREKNCYFRDKYYRLKARRGHKRAIVAIAHKILVAIYHILASDTPYQELGADYLEKLEPERLKLNLARRLERLGYCVNLEPNRA